MSVIDPRTAPLHQFFRSVPMPCPYLPGRVERKLFTRLGGPDAAGLNTVLSQAGFRRSHDIVYRPVCPGCQACVPVRIPVARFAPQRTLRRIWRANQDLAVTTEVPVPTAEQYDLFIAYQRSRHGDSDMARMTEGDYALMVEEGAVSSAVVEVRSPDGCLRGSVLIDLLTDGLSAVYSFFDPDSPKRSLGTYLIMALVELARRDGLDHVYLGYWIGGSDKMDYKSRFRPLERLTESGWQDMSLAEMRASLADPTETA